MTAPHAKRAAVALLRRTPPPMTRRLARGFLRSRVLTLHSEVLRVHPVGFDDAPTPFGFRIGGTTADLLQRNVYLFGVWEPGISRWVASHLREGDVVVDVGANVGYLSLLAARRVGPRGAVVAFEPVPSIVRALHENLALNDVDWVRVEPVIASDTTGSAEIFRGDPGNLGLSATAPGRGRVSEGHVDVVRAADRIDEDLWPRIRLVKVDTEGDDLRALRGLEPVLSAMPSGAAALVEITPDELRDRGSTPEEIVELLRASGFSQMMAIENRYDVDFYVDQPSTAPAALTAVPSSGQTDVVFLKP